MEEFELEPGEKVIRVVRKSWVILALTLIPFAILAYIPFLVPTLVSMAPIMLAQSIAELPPVGPFLASLWWILIWMAAFRIVIMYFLNQWVITTTRIVDIVQFGFFDRRVSSFLLERVQDVTTNVNGLLATIAKFGVIEVETAGNNERFFMRGLRHPEEIRDLIMREIADLKAHNPIPPTGV